MAEAPSVQVIGGGISGLSLAHALAKRGERVLVVEKESRMGGMLQTVETPFGLVERAANSMITNRVVEETAREIGVELCSPQRSARKRYIFRSGKPTRWPLRKRTTLKLIRQVLPRFLLQRSRLAPLARETVRDWSLRVLGEDATDFLVTPALFGVYAADARELSASLLLKRVFSRERLPRGKMRGAVAPLGGMEQWILAYRAALVKKGVFFDSEPCEGIPTFVALPPPAAAEFLRDRAPLLARAASQVKMLPVLSVTVFYPPHHEWLDGYGCLFPRTEGLRVLGILANSRSFPNRGREAISETWIFGGGVDPEIMKLSDEEILRLIRFERSLITGHIVAPLHSVITRWPSAIPLYNVELETILNELRPSDFREGCYQLFGTYLGDLGLGRVLLQAEEVATSFRGSK